MANKNMYYNDGGSSKPKDKPKDKRKLPNYLTGDTSYIPSSSTYTQAQEAWEKAQEQKNKETITLPTITPPTVPDTGGGGGGGGGGSYNWYDEQRKLIEKAYETARNNADNLKKDTISNAYDKYLRDKQSYGINAENLARTGFDEKGGYSQLMGSNKFNAYANMENQANNSYAQMLKEIELAESADKVDLGYKKYETELKEKEQAYNNELKDLQMNNARLESAFTYASGIAEMNGSKIKNESVIREKLQKNFSLSDDYIDMVIKMLTKK